MLLDSRLRHFAAAALALALAACSAGATQFQPQGSGAQSVAHRAPSGSISPAIFAPARRPASARSASWFGATTPAEPVFVADTMNNVIEIFDLKTDKQTGSISGLSSPEGLATDTHGNLYESDTATQTIRVYAKPWTGTPTILQDTGEYPAGEHVDAHGNLWVANICSSGSNCLGGGNVVEYAAGKGNPTALSGGPFRTYYVTTDASGNVWADGQNSSGAGEIGYWTNGAGSFTQVPITLSYPGGLQFDKSGNLLLDDQSGAPNGGAIINIFPPGATTPSGSITVQSTGEDVLSFVLGKSNQRLLAPNFQTGKTEIITYPAGAMLKALRPTPLGEPDAAAVIPPPSP